MPLAYGFTQSGFSIKGKAGVLADFGALGNLASLVDGAFAFVFDIQFLSNKECTFFGGSGTGTRELFLKRNAGGSKDDSITFTSVDASGDQRTVKWKGVLAAHDWARLVLNSSALGANNLNLHVDSVQKGIDSQTNDAGFNADESFDLGFGEVEAGVIAPFFFTSVYVYNRLLTQEEIDLISKGIYPADYVRAYPFYQPNIGLADESLLPANT